MFDLHSLPPQIFEVPSGFKAVATYDPTAYAWSVSNSFNITFYGQPTREDIQFAEREADLRWTRTYYPERLKRLPHPTFTS